MNHDPTPQLRLSLVGPVEPFRGGISQHTTQVHRALDTRCSLQTISFSRQYPAWLYPGKTDREPGRETYREPGVTYLLDALNPLSWMSAIRAITRRGCDLALISWWTLFWAPALALIARSLRKKGIPVVMICHNPFDHDSGRFKRTVSTWMLSQADGYIVHSSEEEALVGRLFPGKPVRMRPPPTYAQCPPPNATLPKRGKLELLFFGFIRPYKGLDVLLDALAGLNDSNIYLTVVGEPWCSPQELRRRVGKSGAPNVELHLEYTDEMAVANYFARADLVVLPYRSATGSGVAALAYHYDRPILATRTGVFMDVVVEGRTGYLVDPGSAQQLAGRLRTVERPDLDAMQGYIRSYKTRFSWGSLADTMVDLASELSNAARSRPA